MARAAGGRRRAPRALGSAGAAAPAALAASAALSPPLPFVVLHRGAGVDDALADLLEGLELQPVGPNPRHNGARLRQPIGIASVHHEETRVDPPAHLCRRLPKEPHLGLGLQGKLERQFLRRPASERPARLTAARGQARGIMRPGRALGGEGRHPVHAGGFLIRGHSGRFGHGTEWRRVGGPRLGHGTQVGRERGEERDGGVVGFDSILA
mmetsp:Transcript_19513/g.63572  ORF Transcript_19513/g.63572 Transcript_19513/m.63572 type:complete len:210 (+) Transcript_19513:1653-2282(+)